MNLGANLGLLPPPMGIEPEIEREVGSYDLVGIIEA
jgi:hypothetical protein